MKKSNLVKIKALLLSFVLLFSSICLCSCHGQKAILEFEIPESFDENKEYNITFWAKNDNNIYQVEVYQRAIENFEKLYPNIHVTLKKYTDYKKIYSDVITNISTNTTPNVCITYPDHLATYLTGSNVVVPLDELMKDEKYGLGGTLLKFDGPKEGELIEKYLDECRLEGTVYALPFIRSTECLYINKALVEKLGYTVPDIPTWEWIFEVSEAAMKKNEDGTFSINGQNVMIPFIYKSTDNMMITALEQLGIPFSDSDGNVLVLNDDTKDYLNSLAPYFESRSFDTFTHVSYPGNYLNSGQAIFGIDSTGGATWMGVNAVNQEIAEEEKIDYDMVVRMIPQYDVDNPKMISQGPSVCIFNKEDNGEVLASWLFAQYLLSNETQISYCQTEGYLPVTTKAIESSEYQDYLKRSGEDNDKYYSIKIDATRLILDNIDNTFVTEVFNGSASLREAAGELIESLGRNIRNGDSIDDAYYENLFSKISTLYHLDEIGGKSNNKKDFSGIPKDAKALLIGIAIAWLGIALAMLLRYNKAKRTK